MSPKVLPPPRPRNPNRNLTDQVGTFDTSGTSGRTQYSYDAIVDVFKGLTPEPEKRPEPVAASTVEVEPGDRGEGEIEGGESGDERETPIPGVPEPGSFAAKEATGQGEISGSDSVEGEDEDQGEGEDTSEDTGEDEGEDQGDVDDDPADADYSDDPEFTPVGRTVKAVNSYLDTASDGESERVLEIERDNNARVGILEGPHA